MTAAAPKVAPMSSFSDANNKLHENPRFVADIAIVEKKGLNFKVTEPAKRTMDQYEEGNDSTVNNHILRAPKAKIYINWN